MPDENNTQNNQSGFVQGSGFSQQSENLNSEASALQSDQSPSLVQPSQGQQNPLENSQSQSNPPSETAQKQEPFLQAANSPLQTPSSLDSTSKEGDKGQKTVLLLAILFFIFSLVGLSFYFFSGIAKGRFSLTGLFSGRKQVATPVPEPTSVAVSETLTPTPVVENLVYKDSVLSFEYPQGMSVVKKNNLWGVIDPSLKNATESGNVILEISLVSDIKKAPVDYLVDEVAKTDKKLTKSVVENLILNEKIGDYDVYSYKFADNSIIYVFKKNLQGELVKVIDFSYKLNSDLSKNLAESLIPTISFAGSSVAQSPSPSVLPSSTPSAGKFNLGE